MSVVAWFEPTTLSVFIYFCCSLFKGHGGVRLLKRRLRKARYWGKDILTDELSEFLCDHPELLFVALLSTSALKLVHHSKPSLKDHVIIGLSGSPDFQGLPLSCRHPLTCQLSRSGRCIRHSGKRLHLKLSRTLETIRSATDLQLKPCLRDRGDVRHRGNDIISHLRLMPFLWDGAPIKRR